MTVPVIEVPWDNEGIFRSRPNRFLGIVDIINPDGTVIENERVHIHDPGRLRELLYPSNRVLVKRAANTAKRKTHWDLLAGKHTVIDTDTDADTDQWVFTHAGYHRAIAEWVLGNERISPFGQLAGYKPEVRVGHSRLDFELTKPTGRKILVEVKGCTLAVDGRALFPDAPTERGQRHIETLMEMKASENVDGAVLILVFRPDAVCFAPNDKTDPAFGAVFRAALRHGIQVYPLIFRYEDHRIHYQGRIPVCADAE